MKEELIKEKMLTEFREWFCDGYCQFYDIDITVDVALSKTKAVG